ncbi:hypothetical protein DYB37_009023 [Aphanomyces astaci]|uniref:Sec16 Sec23-binding domain-containing protein n=1 Tax=Aphanomyces astaci TaxID=112090 RepID=A0A418ELC0_APHAT|nr:hypothetical protein DYB37_009023 [Aphanomyces astaci]
MDPRANAATAWSPVKDLGNLFALGTTSSELHLVSLDFSAVDAAPHVVGLVPTPAPFRTLAWSPATKHVAAHPWGLVAGGLEDGTVSIWDPTQISTGHIDALSTVSKHKGAVTALQFNPNKDSSHLLASGGAYVSTTSLDLLPCSHVFRDGDVWIMSVNNVAAPGVFSPGTALASTSAPSEITCVSWNTTAPYILATGDSSGHVTVWDLKQKKPCFNVSVYGAISSLAWSPHEGFLLLTATRQSPLVHIWDLRASNSVPLVELHGHHGGGIVSAAWCPHGSVHQLDELTPDAFCDWKLTTLTSIDDDQARHTWSFLKVLFEPDARKQLLVHLGFDGAAVPPSAVLPSPSDVESGPLPTFTAASEASITRSLLVGNFDAAVDVCLANNQLANALLLATCGGPELWHRTQEAFFSRQTRPFMQIVAAIIKNELDTLVLQWKQTLAILSTYSKSDEFPALCDQLAWRLLKSGDAFAASLCFICAMNMPKTVELWTAAASSHGHPAATVHLVEQIHVLAQGTGQSPDLDAPVYEAFAALVGLNLVSPSHRPVEPTDDGIPSTNTFIADTSTPLTPVSQILQHDAPRPSTTSSSHSADSVDRPPPFVRTAAMANISEDDLGIVETLTALLSLLSFQKLSGAEAKQLAEAVKAKDALVAKLNAADLSPTVLDSVHDMAAALQRRDFKAAQQVHVALTSSHWALQKEWLRGLKPFYQLCIKRLK